MVTERFTEKIKKPLPRSIQNTYLTSAVTNRPHHFPLRLCSKLCRLLTRPSSLHEVMVKTPVSDSDKAHVLSTSASSSATKRSRKKKGVSFSHNQNSSIFIFSNYFVMLARLWSISIWWTPAVVERALSHTLAQRQVKRWLFIWWDTPDSDSCFRN